MPRPKAAGRSATAGGWGSSRRNALAVLPAGEVLGLLDVAWHASEPAPEHETLRQRQARWNKSDVWAEVVEAIGRWEGAGKLVQVGDRHADQFRHLGTVLQQGQEFVVRVMHDRYVDEPAQITRIWTKLEAAAGAGADHGPGRGPAGSPRTAHAAGTPGGAEHPDGSGGDQPPVQRSADQRLWPTITAWGIYLKEENPPADLPQEQVVEWMLLSSLAAEDLASAVRIVGYYTRRWVIEEWHRCYKQGCRIEASQLDDVEDLQRLGAILCVVAVRLLQVRDLADPRHPQATDPQALRQIVPPLYLAVVARLCRSKASELTPAAVLPAGGQTRRIPGAPDYRARLGSFCGAAGTT